MARINRVKSFRGTKKTADGTLRCGNCGDTIAKGDSYIWWANRMGRMSLKSVRCSKAGCYPKAWEYQTTSPHIRGLMQAEEGGHDAVAAVTLNVSEAEKDGTSLVADFADDLATAVQEIADQVQEVADGYRESAENIESGFEHATYQSEELEQKADGLESQAMDLGGWEPNETEPPEKADDEDDDDYEATLESWADALREEANDAITAACEVPY